jgi:dihydroflavonol-4-reductase
LSSPVAITGGSGFVGGEILRLLVEGGSEVRALVRSQEAADRVRRAGARPLLADLLDPDGLTRAVGGCEIVYHAAGLNRMCLPDPAPLMRTNVLGTVNLVGAAARAGVRRVVYTSSAATLGDSPPRPGAGAGPARGFLSAYERSKHEAERRALGLAARRGLELVCLNPSSVQGPGRTSGTARWLISYANGRLRWLIDAPVSLVDVADCARAHLLAAGRGAAGRRYVVSGATLRLSEMVEMVAGISARARTVRYLPAAPAIAAASVAGAAFRLAGRRGPVCREMVRTLAHGHAYDGEPAARELGFTYTALEDTLRRTLDWYRRSGHVAAA